MENTSYRKYLLESLKNPIEAAGYLNEALQSEDIELFLMALRHVIEARGGVTQLSEKNHKNRTSLYKSLFKKKNPYLRGTSDILSAINMRLLVSPKENSDDNPVAF